jgi:hypothetical protein
MANENPKMLSMVLMKKLGQMQLKDVVEG